MDNFLDGLVADLKPVRPRRPYFEALAIATLCCVELALWLAFNHARPNLLHIAQTTPTFWWKLASFGVIAVLGGGTAISSLNPAASPHRGLVWIAAAIVGYLAAGPFLGGRFDGLVLVQRLAWRDGFECLEMVVLLSTPVMALLGLFMRNGATTHRASTALACGIAAAAWAAFVWTFACDHDDPLYVAVWYTLACAISATLGRILLPLVSRW